MIHTSLQSVRLRGDLLISDDFKSASDYSVRLESEMNDVGEETIQKVQDYLQDVKDNVHSLRQIRANPIWSQEKSCCQLPVVR